MASQKIPFLDMSKKLAAERSSLHEALDRVLDSKILILGKEVESFEAEFARDLKVDPRLAISCNSGTDAIVLGLKAMGVTPNSEVILPSHTAVPTVTAVRALGAIPRFADVDKDTWVLDCKHALSLKTSNTSAIVAVHLYGNAVNLSELSSVNSIVLEDVAQAHGGSYGSDSLGTWGRCGAFSFYPTKNLGAFGDGGAVTFRKNEDASRARSLRFYGQSSRYKAELDHGINSRLDEIQAAFLRIRLPVYRAELQRKKKIHESYSKALSGLPLKLQKITPGSEPAWHLCVAAFESKALREKVQAHLEKEGIGSLIHYPTPNHLQSAFREFKKEPLPVTESLCERILSLPFHADLPESDVEKVSEAIRKAI